MITVTRVLARTRQVQGLPDRSRSRGRPRRRTRSGDPSWRITCAPVADGGDGTVAAAVAAGWMPVAVKTTGPTGRPIATLYAVRGSTAVVELASAVGLVTLPGGELDPLGASTFGLGTVISHALDQGAREIIVGLGGSASTDGGAGMLQALGVRILDAQGNDVAPGGAALRHAARVDLSGLHPAARGAHFQLSAIRTSIPPSQSSRSSSAARLRTRGTSSPSRVPTRTGATVRLHERGSHSCSPDSEFVERAAEFEMLKHATAHRPQPDYIPDVAIARHLLHDSCINVTAPQCRERRKSRIPPPTIRIRGTLGDDPCSDAFNGFRSRLRLAEENRPAAPGLGQQCCGFVPLSATRSPRTIPSLEPTFRACRWLGGTRRAARCSCRTIVDQSRPGVGSAVRGAGPGAGTDLVVLTPTAVTGVLCKGSWAVEPRY